MKWTKFDNKNWHGGYGKRPLVNICKDTGYAVVTSLPGMRTWRGRYDTLKDAKKAGEGVVKLWLIGAGLEEICGNK